ncbi:MAG: ATP-binding domain-containing protein [Myxococcota bacterium]
MHARDLEIVQPGTREAEIIEEELSLLAKVQKELAREQLDQAAQAEYDQELLSLRDQISEAHAEDLAPLIAEMYRMQALGAANGKGRSLPVDVNCPYFGHLKLDDGKKTRDVLIGNRGFVKAGTDVAIVDWRNAPVSRIYYRYEEGDDYDEAFGGRANSGVVEARRTVSIVNGQLRRIAWSTGSVARKADGDWVTIPADHRPSLAGGAGVASRPPAAHEPPPKFEPGSLGVVGDESLREDKYLREITALIDRKQFELITKPDSGIVILQGGAGSGKTTVALHRAAYLHFQDPSIFSPKKMSVIVKSEPLTEYISRVLPSLDVAGTQVLTLSAWMERTRKKVLPELKQKRVEAPAHVARIKKHPAILALLDAGAEREARAIREQLEAKLEEPARRAVLQKWDGARKQALLTRVRELGRWVDGVAAQRAGVDANARRVVQGILRRAKSAGDDVFSAWTEILTDPALLREALHQKAPGQFNDDDIDAFVRWTSLQADDSPVPDETEEPSSRPRPRGKRAELEAMEAEHVAEESVDRHDDRSLGADGVAVDEEGPRGRLDEHDDALLLRLVQLKYGGLPVAGTAKTITYEHVIVDEAQDLSPTDIAVLRGALTRRECMTLAGDTAQKLIFDNGFETWDALLADVGIQGVKIDQLKVSYRSTRPVVDFSRHVLGPLADPEPPVVPRDGVPVEQFTFGSTGEAIAFLGEALRSLVLRERKANIAVIARYAAQADIYAQGLRRSEVPAVRRVFGKDFSFAPGIDVVDVAQVKGLEYDYVVLVEVNANTYPEVKEARHLLHIAATRTVHQLWVLSTSEPSPLLPDSIF